MHSIIKSFIPLEFKHTHALSGTEFKAYKGPMVYVWKRGDEWLYVGMSTRGIYRIMNIRHGALGENIVYDDDEILMMYNLTINQARRLEFKLIREYKPKYNRI